MGEVVVGQFAVCRVKGCNGQPGEKCPKCGSSRVEQFSAPGVPDLTQHCWDCGKCWWNATG